ncbi:cytoplasmic membrane protein [Microscilla marina ATCC 23134]|uniref:Cytoplasmic membrane protein n=1 Tax=Microscilla marina ATCC 23134 TaxID=313606 RepID=A1ZJX0_MICM2|nr:cytoplasmic membrane protein [Microscilla marina ATCC 23134]
MEILQLKRLQALDLFENLMDSIPPEISKLSQLRYLDLGNNEFTQLPSEIEALTELKILNLFMNPISKEEIARIEAMLPHCIVIYE